MYRSDRPKFVATMNALGATFGVDVSEVLIDAYWAALEDLPLEAVQASAAACLRSSTFMPRPVELRDGGGVGGANEDARALLAWQAVVRAIREVDAYASVDFDDSTTTAAIRSLGGWVQLCDTPSAELHKWSQRDFLSTYRSLRRSQLSEEATAHLPGIHEASNAGVREHAPAVHLIAMGLPRDRVALVGAGEDGA